MQSAPPPPLGPAFEAQPENEFDGCKDAGVAFQSPQSRITPPNLQDDIELRLKALGSARADTTERTAYTPIIDPWHWPGSESKSRAEHR
tara:strand:+ start:2475 stop:2741 length:267 start_codon:yes stop_codon:yes gene_type:complete